MKDDLRSALNKIDADDALKTRTADFLYTEIRERLKAGGRPGFRLVAVGAAFLLLVMAGGFSYRAFFTSAAYVDVDINPSLGLVLNRFNRVIDARAFNESGTAVLAESTIRFRAYRTAMETLLAAMIAGGHLADDGFVYVSVQSRGREADRYLLASLDEVITASLTEHRTTAQATLLIVSEDVRVTAHSHRVTPVRYLAIRALQAVDPTVTFEECRNRSIGEIRARTRGCRSCRPGNDTQTAENEQPPGRNHHRRNHGR